MDKTKRLVGMVLLLAASMLMADETEILGKAAQFSQKKDYAAALELLDGGLREYGETEALLAAKFQVLLELGRPRKPCRSPCCGWKKPPASRPGIASPSWRSVSS